MKWIMLRWYRFFAHYSQKNLAEQAMVIASASSVTFTITLAIARAFSKYYPAFGWSLDVRMHHYNVGILMLEIGFLSLIFQQESRIAKFLWTLVYGVAAALYHDEFEMVRLLREDNSARDSWIGVIVWPCKMLTMILLAKKINQIAQQILAWFTKAPPEAVAEAVSCD